VRTGGSAIAQPDLFIITGAPGTGKTAILDQLGRDVCRVGEPAREILSEQRSIAGAGTPDRDPSLFLDLLLRRSIDKYTAAREREGPSVFDRGVPDCVAYSAHLGLDLAPSVSASQTYRYNREVLACEPWEEIYTVDEERTMSLASARVFHEELVEAYERTGYVLVEVPRDSVEHRAAFVRDFIATRSRPWRRRVRGWSAR
jgi:predicted ATPase